MNNKVLSICIPTYNRSRCIREQLSRLSLVDKEVLEKVEILISDNCSPDDTQQVIESYYNLLDFVYIRNNENIGPDSNFLQCIRKATGKYVWLLGDDDFINQNNISKLLEIISNHEFGLVHIIKQQNEDNDYLIYTNNEDFIKEIGIYITFMSGNIIRKCLLDGLNLEHGLGTNFVQVPMFLYSAIKAHQNCMIYFPMYKTDEVNENGNYNIFKVFIVNYIDIFKEFKDKRLISNKLYVKEKQISKKFVLPFVYKLLVERQKSKFDIAEGWDILYSYFGKWGISKSLLYICILNFLKHTGKIILFPLSKELRINKVKDE
jgi:glycosyltransferase involved in cell wall biosynthesis